MDEVEWRFVYSSDASRVGYNITKNQLYVEWQRTGKISVYGPDFPYELFDRVSKAPSVGSILRTEVRPNFKHFYL